MRARLLLILVMLSGCAAQPRPADPPLLKSALEAESDGARRFQQGEYLGADRRFRDAERLFASIDDPEGRARNRTHQARVALAQGDAAAALALLDGATTSMASGMLRAQALLSAGRTGEALRILGPLADACAASCAAAPGLAILRGRGALAEGDAATARAQAELALARLKDRDEPVESANAWRLLAAARLAGGDAGAALRAGESALDIDRRLALPAKIARDWLLLGDIHRADAGDQVGTGAAAEAYRRALDVAVAAGLEAITLEAKQALQAIGMQKK